ncbi:hypothetical protein C8Q77DRAFT_1188202 [Trametes polyzona]|nr:hypothetical protein C8Q77DRAFT_1188202 [Trametes polyzona]
MEVERTTILILCVLSKHGRVNAVDQSPRSACRLVSDMYWEQVPDAKDDTGQPLWVCTLCPDKQPRRTRSKPVHEEGMLHQALKREADLRAQAHSTPDEYRVLEQDSQARRAMVEDATLALLSTLAHTPEPSRAPSPEVAPFDWGLRHPEEPRPTRPLTLEQEVSRTVAQALLERLESDDEEEERESADVDEVSQVPEPSVVVDDGADGPPPNLRKRALPQDDAQIRRHWFPWVDKITCTLDVLTHLPRSVFSQRQLDLFLWLLRVNDVEDVPSVRNMLRLNVVLQRACGIDSIAYKGVLGHPYYVNALNQIIAQEMGNPLVRPHLSFYPENTDGRHLSEARQGAHWLEEVPDDFLTPMVRVRSKDYYVHEPMMCEDGRVCMPMRWFTRAEGGHHTMYAKCWDMEPVASDTGSGWRVMQTSSFEVPASRLLKNFPDLCAAAPMYDLPPPTRIFDVTLTPARAEDPPSIVPWTYTNPANGNVWRVRAKGHRVVAFPLWMYCDDTSGNLSKKWNEHNSVLITAAGLPREHAQKEYNIHFLTTSNIAPPLEMMDGVVDQLRSCQKDGVWAWDCTFNEPVLVIPSVLALLGDNPMQSEFACHIGLQAKLFCRNCWVKGRDVAGEHEGERAPRDDAAIANASDRPMPKKRGRAKRALESMSDMVCRVKAFLKPGTPRNKHETAEKLQSYFTLAAVPGTKTKIKERRTESGIKDTLQLAHLEQLFNSYKTKRGFTAKQAALSAAIAELPETTTNPIWRIRELDAHQDTPVEVLHVVLLGFVKYFWRDLIQGQLKNKDELKDVLATRLSSLDVSGLGISPLAGKTLVQYAGSLTGRDFRALAQAAPFVIYDMVSAECYQAWVALSRLVPLIWEPHIENVAEHLVLLKKEIDYFLHSTARWTVRWFNKPKFHIILHLVEHVRRFGPAGLFATEAFESFNAVIRAKSVHSNRQAPSRDIARAFAQSNRVRHLLSGGYFMFDEAAEDTAPGSDEIPEPTMRARKPFSFNRADWRTVGAGPRSLVAAHSTSCSVSCSEPKFLAELQTGQHLPAVALRYGTRRFRSCREVILKNGDRCIPGSMVIAEVTGRPGQTMVGRVDEILTPLGSLNDFNRQADRVLLHCAQVSRPAGSYGCPYIDLQPQRILIPTLDVLCTVNVQHDCQAHQCAASGSLDVRQERQLTGSKKACIVHVEPSDGLILNICQMRDARHLKVYRPVAPTFDPDQVVLAAVAQEVNAQKSIRIRAEDSFAGQSGGTGRPSGVARDDSLPETTSGRCPDGRRGGIAARGGHVFRSTRTAGGGRGSRGSVGTPAGPVSAEPARGDRALSA